MSVSRLSKQSIQAGFPKQQTVWDQSTQTAAMDALGAVTLTAASSDLTKTLPLPIDVGYPGQYGLIFEKAVSAWWVGRKDESLNLFTDLSNNPELDSIHKAAVQNNLASLGHTTPAL